MRFWVMAGCYCCRICSRFKKVSVAAGAGAVSAIVVAGRNNYKTSARMKTQLHFDTTNH